WLVLCTSATGTYGAMAFLGGGAAFFLEQFVRQVPASLLLSLDAAGLALFAVAGAVKALAFDIHPFVAILMGGITGGGGTVRDILLAQIPTVLRADIYAVAALAGAAVMVAGLRVGGPRTPLTILGACVCFLLRMVAVWQHWSLPRAG
ncbi:MAG: trimeric intracellular cation channel family protein, partial [Bryobacteraceae bacterium]